MEPNFSIDFTAQMLATEACERGDLLVYNSSLGRWKVATSANRTAADAGAQAVALTVYGGSAVGKVSYQATGIVAAEVSGIGRAASRSLVRTSSDGRFERIASYTAGDDIVGYAETDGRVKLHMGIPWSEIVTTQVADDIAKSAGTTIDRVEGFDGTPIQLGGTRQVGDVFVYDEQGANSYKRGKPVLPGWYDVTRYGADPTGVAGVAAIINRIIVEEGPAATSLAGVVVYLPPKPDGTMATYRLEDNVHLLRQTRIVFAQGRGRPLAALVCDPWVSGIIVHSPDSAASLGLEGDGDQSTIEHPTIWGPGKGGGLAALDLPVWQANHTYAVGDKVRGTADGHRRWYRECVQVRSSAQSGGSEPAWISRIYSGDDFSVTLEWDGDVLWKQQVHSGIVVLRTCDIIAPSIRGFANAGITIHGNVADPIVTNANGSSIWLPNISDCGGGILTNSGDANVVVVTGGSISNIGTGMAGAIGHAIDDNSFLGCTWRGVQIDTATGYAVRANGGVGGYSTFEHIYVEGGTTQGWYGAGLRVGGFHSDNENVGEVFTGYDVDHKWLRLHVTDPNHAKNLGLKIDDREDHTLLKLENDDAYSKYAYRYERPASGDPDGTWVFGLTGASNLRMFGFTQKNSEQGLNHFRLFEGFFVGQDPNAHYIGYDTASRTAPLVRSGDGIPGYRKPDDRFEPKNSTVGSGIGKVVITEGWEPTGTWAAYTSGSGYNSFQADSGDAFPAYSVEPTVPNGYCYVVSKSGHQGAVEPVTWPTASLGPGIVPWAWSDSLLGVKVGQYGRPDVPNGYYYQCIAVTNANVRGFAAVGASEPGWLTTIGATFPDGHITWQCVGVDTGTWVSNGQCIFQCVGPKPVYADYGAIGTLTGTGGITVTPSGSNINIDGSGISNAPAGTGYAKVNGGAWTTTQGVPIPLADGGTALAAVPGSNGCVIFNDSGVYNATTGLIFSKSNNIIAATGGAQTPLVRRSTTSYLLDSDGTDGWLFSRNDNTQQPATGYVRAATAIVLGIGSGTGATVTSTGVAFSLPLSGASNKGLRVKRATISCTGASTDISASSSAESGMLTFSTGTTPSNPHDVTFPADDGSVWLVSNTMAVGIRAKAAGGSFNVSVAAGDRMIVAVEGTELREWTAQH